MMTNLVKWRNFFTQNDPECAYQTFIDTFKTVYDDYFYSKKINSGNRKKLKPY